MRYLLLCIFALTLAGCSGNKTSVNTPDGVVEVEQDEETVTVTSHRDGKIETVKMEEKTGEMRLTSSDGTSVVSGTSVPEKFPLKVPAGAAVQSAVQSHDPNGGGETFLVQFTTSGTPAETAADYEKQLKDKGLTVERIEQSEDGVVTVTLSGQSQTDQAMVHIQTEEGKTAVMITWTKPQP